MVPQDQSLHTLQQVIDEVDLGSSKPRPRMWAWVTAESVSSGLWNSLASGKGQSQLSHSSCEG